VAAVLACVLVPFEDVVARKFYFLFREPIENQQDNHPRDTNLERDGGDYLVLRRVRRQIAPAFEVMRHEIVRIIRRNNLSVAGVDERKSSPRRADIHRLPEPVQHQNLTV